MRLDGIIQATDPLPASNGSWLPVPLTDADNKQFGQHVLECHLRLAEQDGPQSATFRSLVERLRQELERQ